VVTWSLAVEEQFYLFAPMLVRFLPVRRLVIVLVALLFIDPVIRVASLHSAYGALGWSVFGRADSMALGMLGAIGWRTPRLREALLQNRKALQWCCGIGFAGLVLWLKSLCMLPLPTRVSSFGLTWISVSFGCLLLLVISQPDGWVAGLARMSWLRFLGMISYCLYLVHMPINQFAHLLLLHKDRPHISDAAGIGVSAGALGLSLLVATLSWCYLEKPLIRRGHAYSYGKPNAQMSVTREAVIGVSSQYSKV
jgi:peptidoglycan/LPS O-acetylase OafA/YrhL